MSNNRNYRRERNRQRGGRNQRRGGRPQELIAPYRFVPASKTVVTPHWADYVSHDVPFSDSHSGYITFTVEAKSDIFISNGKASDNNRVPLEFCNYQGRYFIPATTLKGMTRNLVEILSFGALKRRVLNNEDKYGIRSLSHQEYRDEVSRDDLTVGFLTKQDDVYSFQPAKAGRIHSREARRNKGAGKFAAQNDYLYRSDPSGNHTGKVVLTGNMPRKRKDYVFLDDPAATPIEVSRSVVRAFKNAYSYANNEANVPEDAVKTFTRHWNRLDNGEAIPVWATVENGEVLHFGLSTNYRLESKIDVHRAIDNAQPHTDRPDLADCIFGFIADEEKDEPRAEDFLKGRVFFRTAWLNQETAKFTDQPITVTLSTPTPSFYPAYLQDGVTYLNGNAKIAGWKRYPIRKDFWEHKGDNDKMNVSFRPMRAGATFAASLYFHNLRTVELGALLSALTLHGVMHPDNGIYFNIGMGKPLGLGKIKITDVAVETKYNPSLGVEEYLTAFESYMNAAAGNERPRWHQSPSVTQLCAMCQEADDEKLKYLGLRDSGTAKNKGWYFRDYPEGKVKISALSREDDIRESRKLIEREKAEQNQLPPLSDRQFDTLRSELLY